MTSDDAREELARLISGAPFSSKQSLAKADRILAAGYEKCTPAGEAEQASAQLDTGVSAACSAVEGSGVRRNEPSLFTRPAGESAGVAEALAAQDRGMLEWLSTAIENEDDEDQRRGLKRVRLRFYDLAARASRAPAADASGVEG